MYTGEEASAETSVNFLRRVHDGVNSAFEELNNYPKTVLGYYALLGSAAVVGGAYEVYDGVTSGSVVEVLIGAGASTVGAKYAHASARSLLRLIGVGKMRRFTESDIHTGIQELEDHANGNLGNGADK